MTETVISIRQLHKSFGQHEVLKGIDLTINQGEVVVIIGHLAQESPRYCAR